MDQHSILRIRAAAWGASQPKAALLEIMNEVAEPLARAEIEFGPRAQEADPSNLGISIAAVPTGQRLIVIPMEELAQLLEAVAKELTFPEAVMAIAFEPVLGGAPKGRRGSSRER